MLALLEALGATFGLVVARWARVDLSVLNAKLPARSGLLPPHWDGLFLPAP